MKKKLTLIVSAVALGALLAVGGTLAWFTDTETATNTVTMGNVKIAIHEVGKDGVDNVIGENEFSGLTFETVTPGANLDKDVTIENTGANAAFIRAKVTFEGVDANWAPLVLVDKDAKWTLDEEDGYYYYSDIVAKEGYTTSLFTDVTVPTTWGNEAANATDIKIIVTAEAIQADNNGTDAKAAFTGNTITNAN